MNEIKLIETNGQTIAIVEVPEGASGSNELNNTINNETEIEAYDPYDPRSKTGKHEIRIN